MVEKLGIVATFEALAELVSQPTRADTGARLLGGHSARITGAQVLAAAGVEVNKLRILARHSGDTILRYVGEAPLAALRLDLGRSVAPVVPAPPRPSGTRRVAARLRNLEAAVLRLDAKAALPLPATTGTSTGSADTLVENLTSSVMHRFRTTGVITICGWNTGKSRSNGGNIATYADSELADRPWWMMCDKCLSTEREVARLSARDDEHIMSE